MTRDRYVTLTCEQLDAVRGLAAETSALELLVFDAGGGLAHVRGYGEHELAFTASVDDQGGVHDYLLYTETT